MAKQKTSTIGIIVVVGFIIFIMALGGGFFKNFAVQDSGGNPTPSPSPTATPAPNSPQSILQQIQSWLGSIWQAIVAFFKQFGINLDNAPP